MGFSLAGLGKNMAAVAGQAAIASITGIAKGSGSETYNDILQTLSSPTLCYVPISCDSLEENNEADVANTMIIAQNTGLKSYMTDNVAPKPRTWDIHGYITALVPIIEDYLLVKPTLLTQRLLLNNAFKSRDTVPFKTDTGEILDVVIVRLKMKSLANAQNAYEITATVQEVDVLDTSTTATALNLSGVAKSSVALSTVKSLGACAAGSAPANVMSFVGKLVK